jgi:hypothetical protein
MKKNIPLVFAFIIIWFSSIKLNAQMNYSGEYINEKGNKILILKDDNTFSLKDNTDYGTLMPIWRLDTLSFGSWKFKDNFIILNTPRSIESNIMKMFIKEEYLSDYDSLLITISNPYETCSSKHSGSRLFRYLLYIDDFDVFFNENVFIEGNTARVYVPKRNRINGVKLWIIPDSFLYPNNLAFNFLQTEYLRLEDPKSNVLTIEIPDFTLEYIGYERYNNEHIIIRNKKLIFRGDVFKKNK